MEHGSRPRSGPDQHQPRGLSSRAAIGLASVLVLSGLTSYLSWTATYDYSDDAGPPIDALIHGRIQEFLTAHAVMGPFSMIVRAPFAAMALITGSGHAEQLYEGAYKWGIFPCMLAAGLLGLYLARVMEERRQPLRNQILVVGLCMISPPALKALQYGHPEEILGAALSVGAVVAGLRGKPVIAIALAACAVANKQWGIFVLLPVAMTLPWRDVKRGALWVGGAIVLSVVPLAIADWAAVRAVFQGITDLRDTFVLPATVWWPVTSPSPELQAHQHAMPDWLGVIGRPLLIAVCLAVPLLLARRVRANPIERALPLLALVLLLRCLLDPLNNVYYHTPFLMALVAMTAFAGSVAPALVGTALIWVTSRYGIDHPQLLATMYLTWAPLMAVWLAGCAYGFDWNAWIRSRGVRGRAAAPQAHLSSSGASTPPAR